MATLYETPFSPATSTVRMADTASAVYEYIRVLSPVVFMTKSLPATALRASAANRRTSSRGMPGPKVCARRTALTGTWYSEWYETHRFSAARLPSE